VVNFEREIYRDPDQDLNSLWWQMAGRIQMIAPPPGRTSPDWASKIHFSGAPVYYQNYILGELMASQIESALQAQLPAGAAFIDRPDAGGFLTERIFKPGASRDWQDTLRHATGEPLNTGHFMQQFVDAR
jgi:peptidyl-dipeptidase A